jgi:hypothetical protein
MDDNTLLSVIRSSQHLADQLAWFDFDLDRTVNGPPEQVHLANGEPLEMIAGDASGGAFMLAGVAAPSRPVVYVGSEGEGGLIAANLRDALALVVGLSSIHDATARPLGTDGGAGLRAWLAECDEGLREDSPEIDAVRAQVRAELDLPAADGLLESLHMLAGDDDYRPVSEHGDVYDSMLR